MGTELVPADLELWGTGYLRAVLANRSLSGFSSLSDVAVSNKEPADGAFPASLIVLRDDGGPSLSMVSRVTSLGVSVLAGTRKFDQPAKDLARLVFGILTDVSLPLLGGAGCPVAAVQDSFGPYSVPEAQDRTRVYFSVEYVVVGTPVG